jgi:hypothetical protein
VDDEELLTPLAEDFLARADTVRADELMFDIEMFTDRNGDGRVWLDGKISQGDVDEAYEDGFPQPWELLRSDFPDPDGAGPLLPDPTAPEYRPSETFGLLQGAHPSSDGLIHYDVVKVENGYLALAIRNWSNRGDLARISRIILTPRNRTPGRININTARTRMARWRDTAGNPERQQWNPLAGLPGVLFAPLAGVAPPFVGSELLSNTSDAALTPDYPGLLPGAGSASGGPLERARAISVSRPEYRDGRYFQTPASLVDYPSERLNDPESPPQRSILSTQVEPLERFQEQYYRFDRMANMITTRSDVFEIIVTAQTGSLAATDQNGDGRIDYRHDFISDGEKKVRIVYER